MGHGSGRELGCQLLHRRVVTASGELTCKCLEPRIMPDQHQGSDGLRLAPDDLEDATPRGQVERAEVLSVQGLGEVAEGEVERGSGAHRSGAEDAIDGRYPGLQVLAHASGGVDAARSKIAVVIGH
jgi:hypothetical protein